jgi:hypothetical protein
MDFAVTIPDGRLWPKTPAGSDRPLGRPVAVPLIAGFRQPSGTYIGTLALEAHDGATVYSTDAMRIALRVTETRVSQVEPGTSTPPAFDGTKQTVAGLRPWTNYLTGTETDPTAAPLAAPFAGDLGMWVTSNTPIPTGVLADADLGKLLPTATTDTTIWYRRAKRDVAEAMNINAAMRTISVDPNVHGALLARAHPEPEPTRASSADLVILRHKPDVRMGGTAPTGEWYGKLDGKNEVTGALTVIALGEPLENWTATADQTLVEIVGQPWVPAVTLQDLANVRASMKDPGNAADLGPATLTCSAPSVTKRTDDTFWLTFTVSGLRKVTVAGRTSVVPVSGLLCKAFDPANPTADSPDGMALHAGLGTGGVGAPATQYDRAALTQAVGAPMLLIAENGQQGARGLVYKYSEVAITTTPVWQPTAPLPMSAINWAFTSVSRPQVWADSVNGAALNLIVQGRIADGNTDLYYARLDVQQGAGGTFAGLALGGLDVAGPVPEILTPNAAKTVFTGGKYLAWQSDLTLVVDGVTRALTVPAGAWDTQREYTVEWEAGGKVGRLAVNPYVGTVRVLRGTVNTVSLTGLPRLQRLTDHLAPDTNPVAVIERYRHADGGAKVYGEGDTLKTSPRVWLFWVRRHDDGLGARAYYRTYTMHNTGTAAAPTITRLDAEVRGKDAAETASTASSADMPERMLPMEALASDGALFVTRQAKEENDDTTAREAGLWVLSTATRGLTPPYPDAAAANAPITGHDLFLQAINVPVPE